MTQPNEPTIQPHTYTQIEGVGYVCNDCGAHAEVLEEVVHYPTCNPGESDRWQQWYSKDAEADVEESDAYQEGSLGLHWDEPPDEDDLDITGGESGRFVLNDIEQGRWDDDPNPYDGSYSEE